MLARSALRALTVHRALARTLRVLARTLRALAVYRALARALRVLARTLMLAGSALRVLPGALRVLARALRALAVLVLAPALMLTDTLGILAVPALAVALMLAVLILAPTLMLAIGLVAVLKLVGEPRVLVGPPIPQILPQ